MSTLNVIIWDVQHGSAAYIGTPGGQHIAIDLGVGDITLGIPQLSPLLQLESMGFGRLDEVIITHPHRDHLGDIFHFERLNPRVLRRPQHLTESEIRADNRPGDNHVLDKYFEIERRYSLPVPEMENPEVAIANGGVTVTCYQPVSCARSNLNDHSLVTFVTYGQFTICIPGDNEAPSWRELLPVPGFCEHLSATTVFVAAHHGREAGHCADIFEYCKPRLVIVSDGPESDTSAIEKYGVHAAGWRVQSRSSKKWEDRYVITTRCDGTIQLNAWRSIDGWTFAATTE